MMFVIKVFVGEELTVMQCDKETEVAEFLAAYGPQALVLISSRSGEILCRDRFAFRATSKKGARAAVGVA
jgi:hypothetical protein